ncbi:putative beta-D-xylosidase 7 [Micractinium conductrix]|uniref:Beta-D-xylosidase 7 n=1 Tax=Micractinium conductrix TaxID=554055 RepID=A0A2P6VNT1_9CHLO|nr:putative beta-D-xylosidase 7 [Micractinium conductrix]|eukprot:PSC75758.1 putative beta-D-xylosidase 7 [Micractinium conductrix]
MQVTRTARCVVATRPPAPRALRATRAVRAMASASGQPVYDIAVKGVDGVLADCPFCHRSLLALEEKHVPYTTTLIDFNNKPQWLLDVNPAGSVPVMKELATGDWVVDSGVIQNYLEEKFPQPELGTAEGSPQIGLDVLPKFRDFIKSSPEEAAAKEADLVACLRGLNDFLAAGGAYIGGERPCATDCAVMPRLYHMEVACKYFRGWEMPAELTALRKYMDAFMARDSWRNTRYSEDLVIKGWERHGVKKALCKMEGAPTGAHGGSSHEASRGEARSLGLPKSRGPAVTAVEDVLASVGAKHPQAVIFAALPGAGYASLDPGLTVLHQLRELDLSGNALRDVSALGTLPYLLRLNLSGNQRLNAPASFKPGGFAALESLEALWGNPVANAGYGASGTIAGTLHKARVGRRPGDDAGGAQPGGASHRPSLAASLIYTSIEEASVVRLKAKALAQRRVSTPGSASTGSAASGSRGSVSCSSASLASTRPSSCLGGEASAPAGAAPPPAAQQEPSAAGPAVAAAPEQLPTEASLQRLPPLPLPAIPSVSFSTPYLEWDTAGEGDESIDWEAACTYEPPNEWSAQSTAGSGATAGSATWEGGPGIEDPTVRAALALGLDPLRLSLFGGPGMRGNPAAAVKALRFALAHPSAAASMEGAVGSMAPSAALKRPWGTTARLVLTTVVLLGPSLLVLYGGSPIRLTSLGNPTFAGSTAAAAAQPPQGDAQRAGGAADASVSLASELAAKEAEEAEAADVLQAAAAPATQQEQEQEQPADDDEELEEAEEQQQRQEAEQKEEEATAPQRPTAEKEATAAAAAQQTRQQQPPPRQQEPKADDGNDEDLEEEEERQQLQGEEEEEEEEEGQEEVPVTPQQGQQAKTEAAQKEQPATVEQTRPSPKQSNAAAKVAKPAAKQAAAAGAAAAAAADTEDSEEDDVPAPKGKAPQAKQQPAGDGHAEEEAATGKAQQQQQEEVKQQQAKRQQAKQQPAKTKKAGGGGKKAGSKAGREAGSEAADGEAAGSEAKAGEDDYLEEEDEEAAVGTGDYLEDDDEGAAARGDGGAAATTAQFAWQNASLPVNDRVEALLAALDPWQKVGQLQSRPGNGIPQLGVPDVNWQEECMHGVKVGKPGLLSPWGATIFPINLAWAATFDDALAQQAASQIGDEMRAHYNRRAREGWAHQAFTNCFGPHVHIVRDPRWGRLAETFGEDPLLQSNMAVAHVRGLQGGDGTGTYLKAGATCKHFIGNDLEKWGNATRHNFDAAILPADMRDTFLPPFEACVREARAGSFMCSYNRVNGVPSCISRELLTDQLRGELGFQGFVVTDCTAIVRMVQPEPDGAFVEEGSSRRASARAVEAGADMACHVFNQLRPQDLNQKLDITTIGHASHKATAVEVAAKGSVLLKNEGALPLNPAKLQQLAVFGPFANQPEYIMGKYWAGTVEPVTTPLVALQAALPGTRVSYSDSTALKYTGAGAADDVAACEASDACVLFLGSRMSVSQKRWDTLKFEKNAYDVLVEGEGHDRTSLLLTRLQERLWQHLAEHTTKPLIVVLNHGGPIDISGMLASPRISAVLSMWQPGQHGSVGVAQLLLGQASPSVECRTPVTWYTEKYVKQLDMTDVRMRAQGKYPGCTYRFWKGKPEVVLFPFGYGLSYANWTLAETAVRIGIDASGTTRPESGAGGANGLNGGAAPRLVATAAVTG